MNYYSDKIAVLTGGAGGIGESICRYLAGHGATVIIADRNEDQAQALAEELGPPTRAFRVDVSDKEQVESLIESAYQKEGRLDLLFNNAGVSINGEFQDISLAQWRQAIDVNLYGVVYGCRSAYPRMIEQGFGQIVNTASIAGLIPGGPFTSYTASKHAVVGFTQALRGEAQQYGIKVNTLCPGYMRTNIQKSTPVVSDYLKSEHSRDKNANMKFPAPDDCVAHMMRGVKRNKSVIVSPRGQKIYWWIYRLFPSSIPFLFSKIIKSLKKDSN